MGGDIVRGGAGNDRLTGRGVDTRSRDVIPVFMLLVTGSCSKPARETGFLEERGDDLFIQLEGGNDSITVRNAHSGIVATFAFINEFFLE